MFVRLHGDVSVVALISFKFARSSRFFYMVIGEGKPVVISLVGVVYLTAVYQFIFGHIYIDRFYIRPSLSKIVLGCDKPM